MDNKKLNQHTKNQHYVPQFYLRKFVNAEEKLEILDCEKRKIVASRSPKSVCCEDYFYSLNNEKDQASQAVEQEFQKMETAVANIYDEIAQNFIESGEITDDQKMAIATFMSMLYLRGPYMRKQIQQMSENMIKRVTKIRFGMGNHTDEMFQDYENETRKKLSDEDKKNMIKMAQKGNYRVEINNRTHLLILDEIQGFRNLIFGKYWQVYISKSNKKFITSDNPVLELFPEWTGKFAYGPTFLQRTHQFAMTPNILIVALDPVHVSGKKVKRKTLYDNRMDNDKILELNFNYPRLSMAYTYANDKSLLQEIIDSANLFDKQQSRKLLQDNKT